MPKDMRVYGRGKSSLHVGEVVHGLRHGHAGTKEAGQVGVEVGHDV